MLKHLQLKTMLLLAMMLVGVTSAWAEDTYELVTSASELSEGDVILITASIEDGTHVKMLLGAQSGNNCPAVNFTVSDNTITGLPTGGQEITLESKNASGNFTFKVGDSSYLYAASSSKNYLKTTSTTTYWSIDVNASSYAATIKDVTSNVTRNSLRYNSNSGNGIFSCYSSGQSDVYIFKKQVASTATLASIALSGTYPVTFYVDETFSHEGMTVTATYDDATQKDVTSKATFTGYDLSTTGQQTVTVSYTENEVTKTADYSITVKPARAAIATIGELTPATVDLGDLDDFTLPITFAAGTTSDDYEVTWTSSDETVLEVDGGTYSAEKVGTVTVTVNVEPLDDDTYYAVSKEFTVKVVDPNANDGSIEKPYTVAEVIAMNPGSSASATDVYVKGFIVGSYNTKSAPSRTVSEFQAANLALADNADETTASNIIPVQLTNNTTPRTEFNVVDKPYNVGVAQVVVKADIIKYFNVPGLKNTDEITKVAEQVSISSNGYATYYTDCALDFTDFNDMYAYTATVTDNTVKFTRVEKVPANTGVLLRNPNGGEATNVVPVTTADNVEGNKLTGTLTDIAALASEDGDYVNYILNKVNDVVGFYKANDKKVAAHKAYLQLTEAEANGAKFFGFGEETSVNEELRMMNEEMAPVYNLAGQRVDAGFHGIVIQNGKKVIR